MLNYQTDYEQDDMYVFNAQSLYIYLNIAEYSSQPIVPRPAVSSALVLLLRDDVFGLKAPEGLISADKDGSNRRPAALSAAPTGLSDRC